MVVFFILRICYFNKVGNWFYQINRSEYWDQNHLQMIVLWGIWYSSLWAFLILIFKVKRFRKGHKNLKKSPACFDESADLLSKHQNKREIFSNFVAFSQCLNFKNLQFHEIFIKHSYSSYFVWGCCLLPLKLYNLNSFLVFFPFLAEYFVACVWKIVGYLFKVCVYFRAAVNWRFHGLGKANKGPFFL